MECSDIDSDAALRTTRRGERVVFLGLDVSTACTTVNAEDRSPPLFKFSHSSVIRSRLSDSGFATSRKLPRNLAAGYLRRRRREGNKQPRAGQAGRRAARSNSNNQQPKNTSATGSTTNQRRPTISATASKNTDVHNTRVSRKHDTD
jgi:hypothetical protein